MLGVVAFHCEDQVGPGHVLVGNPVARVRVEVDPEGASRPSGALFGGIPLVRKEARRSHLQLRPAGSEQGPRERAAADVPVAQHQHAADRPGRERGLAPASPAPLVESVLSGSARQRDPPRPQLSDLRESGSIEQDADVVMFIFREEYYLERKKPGRRGDEDDMDHDRRMEKWEDAKTKGANLADIIIAKQRHGPIGDIQMRFNGAFTRFSDLDRLHNPED